MPDKMEEEEITSTSDMSIAPLIDIDAYAPVKMANRVGQLGVAKANLGFLTTFFLSVNAGVFIALGIQLAMLVTHTATSNLGLNALVGGVAFTMALVLIVITGAELFTGNCLIAMSFFARKITGKDLARNLTISFIGNLIGSLIVVCFMYQSHQWEFFHDMVGAKALLIANKKVNLSFEAAFARGVLCNSMVCLAVWLCFSARNVTDKIISLVFPVGGFIASGFEHCVANMYFIPMGVVLKKNPEVVAAAEKMAGKTINLSQLTWKGFVINNQIPVILGNVVGGVILVGIMFWFTYLRPKINISFNIKEDFPQGRQ